jgi:hypothetical protein
VTHADLRETQVAVIADPSRARAYLALLQEGAALRAKTGVAVRTFLCEGLGLSPSYVSEQLSTVFLNGRPVDDLDSALICDGYRLSLSGALPGLAGAVMRRSSPLAPLRGTGRRGRATASEPGQEGLLWIKLFNVVLEELGPLMLRRGVLVQSGRLEEALRAEDAALPKTRQEAFLNGAPVGLDELQRVLSFREGLAGFAVLARTCST